MTQLYEILIVAGPNGAGKTSFVKQFLATQMRSYNFVNADEIAKGMAGHGIPQAQIDFRAGREMLKRIRQSVELGDNIIVETTLASSNWLKHFPDWRSAGYGIMLYYLRLPNVEAAVARVRRRAATGGHDIPELVIRRRFKRSLANLDVVYKPNVDAWYVFDSLEGGDPQLAESWSS